MTVLHKAVVSAQDDPEVVDILVAHRANIEAQDKVCPLADNETMAFPSPVLWIGFS